MHIYTRQFYRQKQQSTENVDQNSTSAKLLLKFKQNNIIIIKYNSNNKIRRDINLINVTHVQHEVQKYDSHIVHHSHHSPLCNA